MNWLDIVLILILATSIFTSFRNGFSREVIGLVAVVLALILGLWFYGVAGGLLAPHLNSRTAANLAGFFLVFFGVLLLGVVVNFVLGKVLRTTGLSIFDHLLGALFGAVRGIVISMALIVGIMAFAPGEKPPASVVRSRVAPYVIDGARLCAAMAPHELKEGFRKRYSQVKSAWGRAMERDTREKDATI
jgi:membrane protein required for colicin V production